MCVCVADGFAFCVAAVKKEPKSTCDFSLFGQIYFKEKRREKIKG